MDGVDVHEADVFGWHPIIPSSGQVSLTVAPQVGGRIINLKLDDVEAFFTLSELRGRSFDVASARDVRERRRQLGWLHYGGLQDLACAARAMDRRVKDTVAGRTN